MELAYIDVPEEYTGVVIQKLTARKGALGYEPRQPEAIQTGIFYPVQRPDRLPRRLYDGYQGKWYLKYNFDGYAEYKGRLILPSYRLSDRL